MTGFERCALTVLTHVYMTHIPGMQGKFQNTRFKVNRFNKSKVRSFYVREVSWDDIDFYDEVTSFEVFDTKMDLARNYIQWQTRERPYNYIYFDQFNFKSKVIKGSDSGGYFEARVLDYYTVQISDSEVSYVNYIITT